MSIPEPKPQDLSRIKDAAALQGFLPFLRAEVEQMDAALENRILAQMQHGTLTPEAAVQAWQEKFAYKRLLSRFEGRIRAGQSVGIRARGALDLGFDPNDPTLGALNSLT